MLSIIFLVALLTVRTYTKITDKEYAEMPTLFQLDDFDTCMYYGDEALYCTTTYELQPLNPDNPSKIWRIIKEVSSDPINYRHDHLRYGVCIPTTCPNITWDSKDDPRIKEGLTQYYDQQYKNMGLKGVITKIRCETTESPYPIDIFDISVATIAILYMAFVIFASFYEGRARYKPQEYDKITGTFFGKLMTAFSIPKNWDRLKSINTDNPDVQSLRVIQGVRFYNMVCVIMTHTVMVALAMPVSNPRYTETMTQKILNMFIANGGFAVQTFFMISGWLLTYHFFLAYEGKKSIKISHLIWIFVNRYIRLTPTLAVIVILHSSWLVHFGRGPNWDLLVGEEYRRCRKNGWSNLLYINNYIDADFMCMQQTWYLASDMQLFLLSLLIVTIMKKYPKFVNLLLSGYVITGILISGLIAFIKNYDILIRSYPESLTHFLLKTPQWQVMYSSGYANISGYATGILFGYLYYKTTKTSLTIKKVHVVFWWFLTFFPSLFVVLIAGKMYDKNYTYSRLESAAYWAFGKFLFAFAVAVGIFGITQKIGGVIRWILVWQPMQVLGRLTYSAYLVHVTLIKWRGGAIHQLYYLNNYIFTMTTFGDVTVTYLTATVFCLLFEMPISALQKLMLPQNKH